MNKYNPISTLFAMMAGVPNEENPFYVPKRVAKIQNSKVKPVIPKQLYKFKIKGVEIEAYSKKDAIKRYNHQFKK